MADMDEDQPTMKSQSPDHDLSEETQDFRLLASLAHSLSSNPDLPQGLPKRGEKDFEPNPTRAQVSSLAASRHAMHVALSHPRLHTPKNHVIGQYCPNEPGLPYGRRSLSKGGEAYVRVNAPKGQHFRTMGTADNKNRVWLLPEEALYLLERGSLDIRWHEPKGNCEEPKAGDDEKDEKLLTVEAEDTGEDWRVGELPMSLQGAYASFVGKNGLTLERYSVFAGLRRSGYTVVRAPSWDDAEARMNGHGTRPPGLEQNVHLKQSSRPQSGSGLWGFMNKIVLYLYRSNGRSTPSPSLGPLVAPGLYRSYMDIYHALTLMPFHNLRTESKLTLEDRAQSHSPKTPFQIMYHVYKPAAMYRKSNPQEPDFRVAIIDARSNKVPTMSEIGTLLETMPLNELTRDKRLEQRIKHGKRSVILAVVDTGVVSYLRFSDADFGGEKGFDAKPTKGGKKGGGWKEKKTGASGKSKGR